MTDYRPTAWLMPLSHEQAEMIRVTLSDLPDEIPAITVNDIRELGSEEHAHEFLEILAIAYGYHAHTCTYCFRVTRVDCCERPDSTGYCDRCKNG